MAKKKLTEQQKKWLNNLQEFVKTINWNVNHKDNAFNSKHVWADVVEFGKYAIFYGRGIDCEYTVCIGETDEYGVNCNLNYNSFGCALVYNMDNCTIYKEEKRIIKPTLDYLLRKLGGE